MKTLIIKLVILCTLHAFYYVSFVVDMGVPSQVIIITRGITFFLMLLSFLNFKVCFTKNHLALILFLIIYSVKFILDVNNPNLDFGRDRQEILIFGFGVTFIPTIAFLNLNIKKEFISLGTWLYYLYNILGGLMLVFNTSSIRLSGNSILNPITAGHIATSSILINLLILHEGVNNLNFRRVLLFFFLFINIGVLILSGSRGPVLCLFVCLLTYFLIQRKVTLKFIFALCVLCLFVLPEIVKFSEQYGFNFLSRMKVDFGGASFSEGEVRVFLWKKAINIFLNNPVLGGSTTTVYGYVHNLFLELMMSTGLLGTMLFLIPVKKAIVNVRLHLKNGSVHVKWLGLLFLQYAVGSIFSGTLYSNTMFWLFFALMLSPPVVNRCELMRSGEG